MSKLLTKLTKIRDSKTIALFFAALFVASCLVFAFKDLFVLPLIAAFSVIMMFFVCKGRYRIYFLIFSILFSKLMTFELGNIGSLLSVVIILYELLVAFEVVKEDTHFRFTKKNIIGIKKYVLYIGFSLFALLISVAFYKLDGLKKCVSFLGYFLVPLFLYLDRKGEKKLEFSIIAFSLSLLITNLLCVLVYYVIKGDIAISFLTRFLPGDILTFYTNPALSFRYPGLIGDPNYLGFYVLFITVIFIVSFKRVKHRYLIIPIIIALQALPILGESKNYFLLVAVGVVTGFIIFCIKSDKIAYPLLAGASIVGVFTIIFFLPFTQPIIKRLLIMDTRNGFLDALTTGRTTVQSIYINYLLSDPLHLLVGEGAVGSTLSGLGAHNTYIMLIWYFGIFGCLAYLLIMKDVAFRYFRGDLKVQYLLPLLIPVIYGLSLDFAISCSTFVFELFIYSLLFREVPSSYEIKI